MATQTTAADAVEPPIRFGRKKLVLMVLVAALVLALAVTGGVVWFLKKRAHDAAVAAGEVVEEAKTHDPKRVPVFVPLDTFTVNLADRDAERYAQVGIALEVPDAKTVDRIKAFMPAVRNNILMVLSHKTSLELLELEGKRKLAAEIRRETERALGHEPEQVLPRGQAARDEPDEARPVTAVHFSNFIIQ